MPKAAPPAPTMMSTARPATRARCHSRRRRTRRFTICWTDSGFVIFAMASCSTRWPPRAPGMDRAHGNVTGIFGHRTTRRVVGGPRWPSGVSHLGPPPDARTGRGTSPVRAIPDLAPAYLTPSSTSVDRERAMGERRARDDEVARCVNTGGPPRGSCPCSRDRPRRGRPLPAVPPSRGVLADPEGETERRLGRPPRSRRVSVATGRAPAAALCWDLAHLQEESGRGPGRDASESPSRFSTWILSKPKARSDSRRAGEPARSTKAISS